MTNNLKDKNLPLNNKQGVDYTQKVLEVKNLKKHFFLGTGPNKKINPAVDDVTFDVYKREVFGLVGESGCGKTTTGRTIIKLYEPTEGTVDLNGVRISAGYLDLVEEIKDIKKQMNEAILSLDRYKLEKIHLEKEAEAKIELIHYDIKDLQEKYKRDLEEAKSPLNDYRDQKYNLRNQYLLDVSNIKYKATLEKSIVEKRLTNQYEIEYQNELKIAKKTYDNKVDGLKDSAALSKEVIESRILDLQTEYDEQTALIEAKYKPLIESEMVNILPKDEGKIQLKAINDEMKEAIASRKETYENERNKIEKPNQEQVKQAKESVTLNYKKDLAVLKASIQSIKNETKDTINALPKSTGLTEEQKTVANQIKAEAKEKIQELRRQIRDIKVVNKAKETLKASQEMQMIFQDPISSLNPRMTVKEIIGEGLKIHGGYDEETINSMVAEVLEIVGLSPEYATRYPHEFSGGQRQRIGIARALIMNPSFIIADEPISALDVSIRAQVINLLTDLKEKLGLTILFIAHDLSVVRFFCDRIAVMYYGKIVELAPAEALFAHPQHPYTISLLSAIPQPDPDYEKGRQRIHYNPAMHDYRIDKPTLREISDGHFVLANNKEFNQMKENYGKESPVLEPKESENKEA